MSGTPQGQALFRPQIFLGTEESNSEAPIDWKILGPLFTGLLVYSTLPDYNTVTKPSSSQVIFKNDSSSCFLSLTFSSVLIFFF